MFKISRPVLYTILGALAVYAIVLVATPDAPPPTHHREYLVASQTTAADDSGTDGEAVITDADRTAHFPRVRPSKRDPFLPGVLISQTTGAEAEVTGGRWQLTGIYVVNGQSSALVENSATGEDVSLKIGDRWRGLRVASIGDDGILFINALGQQTRLSFPAPSAPAPEAGNGLPAGVSPLPPMPVSGILRPLPPLPSSTPMTFPGRPQ